MSAPVTITDPLDPRLDDYRGMRFPDRRMLSEAGGGFFIGEGDVVVRRIIDAGHDIRSVVCIPARYRANADQLDSIPAPVYVVEGDALNAVVGFDLHRGIVAAVNRFPVRSSADLLDDPSVRTIVALERVNDFENLGSIFRSAAALGADAVLLCPQCSDPLYRRSVRVSMGNVVGVPYAVTEPWPAAVETMNAAGFRTIAFTPSASVRLHDVQRASNDRVAILMGAEGPGLTGETLAASTEHVVIPMHSTADSLNVSVTAAIALYALQV